MTASDGAPTAARKPVTILYIDDNATNLRLISRIFEREGDHVVVIPAMLGEAGLALARDLPDLILLDLNLPDIGGEEVLARLRRDPLTQGIPVIVMSADASPAVAERLTGLGAEAFVTKPIAIADFLRVAARFLPPPSPADAPDS